MAESNGAWPGSIEAVTLFVEDLDATKRFYGEVFGLPIHFEDDASAVFKLGNTLISLLKVSQPQELIAPSAVASPAAGARYQFTLAVDCCDAMCGELKQPGLGRLNGPMDRPWGIRTAACRDPGGHIWEIAK